MLPNFVYNDGGREEEGYSPSKRDCAIRSAAIVLDISYKDVYTELLHLIKTFPGLGARADRIRRGTPRIGVSPQIMRGYMLSKGFKSVPCNLRLDEEPVCDMNRALLRVKKSYTAIINGAVCDTNDIRTTQEITMSEPDEIIPSKARLVYEYFIPTKTN